MSISTTGEYRTWMYQLHGLDKPLTSYHLPSLLAAEAGRLTYDHNAYRINAVPNNAANLADAGMLAYGPDGMVLTAAGRARLAQARARAEQPDHPLLRPAEPDEDDSSPDPAPTIAAKPRPKRRPSRPDHPTLFA